MSGVRTTLIAAMTASLGGLDVLVFTGGVGERSSEIRTSVARQLGHLGVAVDPALDAAIYVTSKTRTFRQPCCPKSMANQTRGGERPPSGKNGKDLSTRSAPAMPRS